MFTVSIPEATLSCDQLETRTWIKPGQELATKIAFYRYHFLHITEDGFYKTLGYMTPVSWIELYVSIVPHDL